MTETPINVLLIEDNPGDARLIREMLAEVSNTPVAVECVGRLATGLERLAAGGIDVVLLDLSLPDSQGFETFVRAYTQAPQVAIIVLTGLADEALAGRAVREGAQDYLVKGQVDGNILVRSLRYAIERKRAEERLRLIVEGTSSAIAEEFFRSLVKHLAAALEVRFAFISELADVNGKRVSLISLWTGTNYGENFEYSTKGTPCEDVLRKGSAYFPAGVQEMFPDDLWLREAPIESYLAIPFFDSAGNALGHMGVMHDGPMNESIAAESILRIFASRAGIELERRRAELELKETRARLQFVLASSPAVLYTNQASGDFPCTFVSENFHSMIGYTPREMLDDPQFWVNHLDPEDTSRLLAELSRLIPQGKGTLEYRFRHQDGHYRWIQDTFTVISDHSGRPVEIVGSWADITERKQAEEALHVTNRRLQEALANLSAAQQQVLQQERLRALGQMASGIAHDFNNALMPILGYSELLLDQPKHLDDKEKVAHYLRTINTAAQDAANVVRRLREFYRHRGEDEVFLPVDLNQLVEQVHMLTQPRWKDQSLARGITIFNETHLEEIPPIVGNEAELREVLINLIFNAVDAMPEGGMITVRTRPDGEHVIVEVVDTGIGMTDEVCERCLDPFFSTKGERGTGLGLPMVYGIIQRHQGTIDIQSEPGKGTTFLIRLLVQTEEKAEGKTKEAEAPARRLHVLVVDDERPVREVVTEYLTGDGHTVETAANGREGLEKFHAAGWFDVVLTDRGMPEMSGDQLAAAIKRIAPNKPVILLTGFGDLMQASGEKPVEVDFIASKPVTLSALRQALAEATAKEPRVMSKGCELEKGDIVH